MPICTVLRPPALFFAHARLCSFSPASQAGSGWQITSHTAKLMILDDTCAALRRLPSPFQEGVPEAELSAELPGSKWLRPFCARLQCPPPPSQPRTAHHTQASVHEIRQAQFPHPIPWGADIAFSSSTANSAKASKTTCRTWLALRRGTIAASAMGGVEVFPVAKASQDVATAFGADG